MNSPAEILITVRSLFVSGELDSALRIVTTGLETSGDDGRLWELRGLILHDLGQWEQCVFSFENASLLVPLRSLSRICLAAAYAQRGHRELAKDLFLQTAEDDAITADELLKVSVGLDHIGYSREALNICRRVEPLEPENAQLYYNMGYFSARCGYPEHLVEALARKAIDLDPVCVNYRVGLASMLHRSERWEEALSLLRPLAAEQILEIGCRCCLERMAEIYRQGNDWVRANYCRQRLESMSVH